ncbi:DUF2877 domain-containing protein [Gallibacterium salpingitidis]|uniref:DUF2877 domain-containing protein n=1 Tax=Gallibacterium salpingitidis TaxID=505341 RepID=A0A1A7P4H1_9PAST|nr:DUF2877 domain-containing protein [Gallibacterium salpingitidis]OBW96124.1 hypothetical protein QS62_01425 [Gallibacterium salpingitidis]
MQWVTVDSMDKQLAPVYTLLIEGQFTILSRHRHVLNLQLRNHQIVALVDSSVPQGPRQLRILGKVPSVDEFMFSTTVPKKQFSCDLEYSLGSLNAELLDLSWHTLIEQQKQPIDLIQITTQKYLQKGISNLLEALSEQRSLHNEVKNLLGLGCGLTPSGDDFLCGLLIALCLPQSPFHIQREALVQAILANKQLTNPISIVFLQEACLSQVSYPVQLFIHNLLSASCDPTVIQKVIQLGHRSGYDLLSGLLAGFPHPITKRVHLCPYIVD